MRGRIDCIALSSGLGIRDCVAGWILELGWRVLDNVYLPTYTVFAYIVFL
jgi:hypothetical protein